MQTFIVAGVALVAIVGLGIAVFNLLAKNRLLKRALDRSYKQYRVRQGGTAKHGNYAIITLDDGKHWFNMAWPEEGGIAITGPADPDLLQELEGWDTLLGYVEAHGTITVINDETAQVLRKAGFTVGSTEA